MRHLESIWIPLGMAAAGLLASLAGAAGAPAGTLPAAGLHMAWTVAASAPATGTIAPGLSDVLRRAPADSMVSVIIHLRDQAPLAPLSAALKLRHATRRERHREVILALRAAAGSQESLRAQLELDRSNGFVRGYTPYWISNLIVVQATAGEIERISGRGDVDWVEPNFHSSLIAPVPGGPGSAPGAPDRAGKRQGIGIPPGIRAIRAPEVWHELGIDGSGRLVANLDTGVDGTHPALAARWRGLHHPWQECWLDTYDPLSDFPRDSQEHGTHVLGTLTGLGLETGDTIGVAWGAEWIACSAVGRPPAEQDNEILQAFQWFADPDGDPNTIDDVPDVIQNSWGNSPDEPTYRMCSPRWWEAIDNCEAAGVVTTWSAGNSGPGSATIIVPADRATTPTNTFSIGAVDATAYTWPYPIANFSSRGPTDCQDVPDPNRIKPEVVAPGVQVYSSVPGGGYASNWSGTSMAGPHAAGIVALMRQADPDLDVDSIKRILMETARDEGPAGEDNTYGWGFVDAYAAVRKVLEDYGTVEGQVRNGSWQDEPLPQAVVSLAGSQTRFRIDDQGYYRGSAPNGTYTLRAFLDGFAPDSVAVSLQGGHPVRQDFVLIDNAGPVISRVDPQEATHDTLGPYRITASVTDVSTVAGVGLHYRFDRGGWAEVPMTPAGRPGDPPGGSGLPAGADYEAVIPGAPAGTEIAYYISAVDGPGAGSLAPAGAPAQVYQLEVRRLVYSTGFEDPPDPDWHVGAPGDEAASGIWTREVPIGTSEDGRTIQTGRDHTPDPGEKCYLTGNGVPGGGIGDADVDGGCTSLLSPVFDLSHDRHAFVSYARWFGEGGAAQDDTFRVDVSSDGGASWQALERVGTPDTVWVEPTLRVDDHVALTSQVRFRFQACDLGLAGVVEAALDDFLVEGFTPAVVDSDETPPPVRRLYNLPNPFLLAQAGGAAATSIHIVLRGRSPVQVEIFDAAGRRIRRLYDGTMDPEAASVAWDGKDERGHTVRSGVYFCRVGTNEFQETLPLTAISSARGSR